MQEDQHNNQVRLVVRTHQRARSKLTHQTHTLIMGRLYRQAKHRLHITTPSLLKCKGSSQVWVWANHARRQALLPLLSSLVPRYLVHPLRNDRRYEVLCW